ncbi:acyl-CoA thioesterase [Psychrobacillus sp. NPDC096426]|uniref:acyl-CoA thioesterase n=1 Tax=Psychrobacillus sp. NPDC096426 TaxID=3364491 RepID=UPI00381786EB
MASTHLSYDLDMIVTWGDCDAAGISYYAKNFEWFTDAYMQLLAHYGFSYMETFHHNEISLVCLKADSHFKKMVKPLEKITVRASLSMLTRTRMSFTYQVFKENDELASEGETSHAFVNVQGKPLNLQKQFPDLWERLHRISTKFTSPQVQQADGGNKHA